MAAADTPVSIAGRIHQRRRRFMFASVAGLSVLGASLGVSFLGNSGSSSVTITSGGGGSSNLVYPVSDGASVPAAVTSLAVTPGANISSPTVNTAVSPSWSPVANTAGSVTTRGDLAVVDASGVSSSAKVIVSVYITNLSDLSRDYSSFAFPINVYESTCASNVCTWTGSSAVGQKGASFSSYLTDTSGVLTFSLDGGKYYDIVLEGNNSSLSGDSTAPASSFFCISTSTSSGSSLSPSFFFTAQPTA